MKVRSKSQQAGVVIDLEQPPDPFAQSVQVLGQAWDQMVWLNSTNLELNACRREIAAWARATDALLTEAFGQSAKSDEIRVMLAELPGLVPRHPGGDATGMLARLAAEAQALARKGQAAVDAVTAVPVPRPRSS
jgi:hypothetical protein